MNRQTPDRRLELACDRALSGLDPAQEAELVSLLAPGEGIDPRLELAAAAIALSEVSIDAQLPRHLADRVLASATQAAPAPPAVVRGGTIPMPGRAIAEAPRAAAVAPPAALAPVVPITAARRSAAARWVPWLAAAACLALAIGSVVSRKEPRPAEARRMGPLSPAIAGATDRLAARTPAEAKARLLSEAPDAVRVAWSTTKDPAGQGESGDVVWSNTRQQGYMTFRALAPNDPSKTQYQLWIFDGGRDDRYPVDGGVFDVDPSKGEVVIPIAAKVRVDDPKMFAVTVERPGGVVVSKRERLVVAAKVAG